MKNAEINGKLMDAAAEFRTAYNTLRSMIDHYEQETGTSINDLRGFVDNYPFDKSFDELAISQWVDCIIEGLKQPAFNVLNYRYMNTGGNCMVGIFEVWLPEEKRVVYALTNEEGCTLSVVDYISNELVVDDFDELIIDYIDWGRATGDEKYFELYRHCLNEYTYSDCRYFGTTRQLPYFLLSNALQRKVSTEYLQWMEANEYDLIETDGVRIIESPDYEEPTEDERLLTAIKAFKRWHDAIAGDEEYYEEMYKLEIAGHKIELPFMADIWDAVDTMLKTAIEYW